jgi:hypothetical protein
MNKKNKHWTSSKAYKSLIVILIVIMTVTAPLVPVQSYALYSLDPIDYSITVNSGSTYAITSMGAISGTPQLGKILTAGELIPAEATCVYQWQRSNAFDGDYTDIPEATSNTYQLKDADYSCYIRVVATGTGSFSGTLVSAYKGPVEPGQLTAIDAISGTAAVGRTLTAGTLTPSEATCVYQWQKSSTPGGVYADIPGASMRDYELTANDYGSYIRVKATGTDHYTGMVASTYRGPVEPGQITAIGDISGTAKMGSTLTAGILTPSEATCVYQWQRSSTADGTYANITGATAETYTLTSGDVGRYIKVTATGSGAYTGTVTSTYTGPVEILIPEVTDIGPISGDARVGVMLTAGTLTPAEATASYQWQRSSTAGGVFVDITGATAKTYTLTESDYSWYIRVIATATGDYTGMATSAQKGPVAAGQITAIGPISGTTAIGQVLTAGTLAPFGATASYQWQRSDGASAFTNITGATSSTYTLTGSDSGCYIRVVATGTGAYTGTVASEFVGKVGASITPLGSMDPIGGTAEVGQVLTAGTLSPTGAIATYQWQRADSAGGTFVSIVGATANSYLLAPEDKDKYVRVLAIGSGTYSGTLTSAAKGPVAAGQLTAIGLISGTTAVGQTLTAGTLTPVNATVTYQWQRSIYTNSAYENIENANASTYILKASDEGYFIRVVAAATGAFTGTATSAYTGPVSVTTMPVTDIGAISGIAQVNQTLTAGTTQPFGATVTYQWLRCDTADGIYETIPGATFSTYAVTTADMNKYIKLQATGSGNYTGTVTSVYKGPVSAGEITAIGPISGTTAVGKTLTVGTLTPYGATASYQWQRSNGTTAFADIVGGTASSYTLTGDDSYYYIRVVATGTGAFTGTVISDYVGRVGSAITPVTSIGAIGGTATVGQELIAGTVSPNGAIVTYQWKRAATANGVYGNISGATSSRYTLTAADKDQYIIVAAIGSGNYSGTVISSYKGPVAGGQLTAIGPISGTTTVGQTLTAGTLTPYGATASYQWQRCTSTNGTYEDILNANASTYTLKASDEGYYIRVTVVASGAYTGSITSAYTGPVGTVTTPVTTIGAISGTLQVTQTLTAGQVEPSGATVTYQWMRCVTNDGIYEDIPGATSSTYILTAADMSKYIKVAAMGSGTYTGTATSAYKGPVAAGLITAIGPISGTTSVGKTLNVGTLTPADATATYQWQRSNGTTAFTDIIGGTASSYTLTGEDSYYYIRVIATGSGAYSGTVVSDYVGRVGATITPLTSIAAIGGTAQVGETLTLGLLTPTGAIATYQWMRSDTANGTYGNIAGATAGTYTLTSADKDKYIKVAVTGSGNYSGTVVSPYKGPVTAGQLTAIGAIGGTTTVGQTLTAGTLTPINATVNYQWQKCVITNGAYENILNGNASTYTLKTADEGYFVRVVATASGAYTGTAISAYTGPVGTTTTPITAVGTISGTTQVNQTLTAGSVDPAGATVTYQWQRCGTSVGTYEDIPGATANTYTISTDEKDYYIRVQVTGSGNYSGTANSAYKGPVAAGQITAIGPISGTTSVGKTLTVGTLTPYGATASYQWQRSDGSSAFTDIIGGTARTYTLTGEDSYRYIRVVATGTGAYTGTVTSDYVGRVGSSATALTTIGAISGAAQVGEILTAGTLGPNGSLATYQWMRADAPDGTYGNIVGATTNTYTLTSSDKDKYIKVVATGSGNYSGTVTSTYRGPVAAGQLIAIGPVSGTTAVGQTLTAGTLTPLNATVTYQWQRCTATNGTYDDIPNANASTYTLKTADEGYFIRVVVAGVGAFSGTAVSTYTGPVGVTTTPITAIGTISGTARVAQTLTAGTVNPSGATVTYQWLRCDTADGVFENIPGATSNTYTLSADEKDHYIKVQATGSGSYSGTAVSAYKGPVAAGQLTAIGSISGTTAVGQTLAVGALTPYGATAAYQWQRSNGSGFTDIVGGTSSTYTLMGEDSYCYVRVSATGNGAYTGTVYSAQVGRVGVSVTQLTSIGAIDGAAQVGQALTAGQLSPAGTATYQWMRADTANGAYANIAGAAANSYTLTAADKDKYIKVVATGNGNYSGTVTSVYKGPVTAGRVSSIGDISGTTVVGQALAAGTLTPPNATVTYQWIRCTDIGGTYENIPNATSTSYTLKTEDEGYYIKVVATGTGAYTGTATSSPTGPVGTAMTQITSVGAISGTAQVGMSLNAGSLNPPGATATYQWQRCDTSVGSYEDIPGATSSIYTLAAADLNQYIRVQATGSGSYSGTAASAPVGPAAAGQITAISDIIGTTAADETLTAGTVTPLGATVTYQWLYSSSYNGTYLNIGGATSNTYTLSTADNGRYIKVSAIGIGAYTGTVTSDYTGPVNKKTTNLTAIGTIGGTAQVGELLTAGTLNPSAATVTYQWQSCETAYGDYANIPGATASTYAISEYYENQYIRVKATGSGNYAGTVTSAQVGPVAAMPAMLMMMMMVPADETTITAIDVINGEALVGYTLEAGTLDPFYATASYQWQSCGTAEGVFENIPGADTSSYTLTDQDAGKYIQVVATGTDGYTGAATSAAVGPVALELPIIAIGLINGEYLVGSTLTAGLLTPSEATAEFQWQRSSAAGGDYEDIEGAARDAYTLTETDIGCYIRVTATGRGCYSGIAISESVGPVTASEALELVPEPEIPDSSGTTGAGITDSSGTTGAGITEDLSEQTTQENEVNQADADSSAASSDIPLGQVTESKIPVNQIVESDPPVVQIVESDPPGNSNQEITPAEELPDSAETGSGSGEVTAET